MSNYLDWLNVKVYPADPVNGWDTTHSANIPNKEADSNYPNIPSTISLVDGDDMYPETAYKAIFAASDSYGNSVQIASRDFNTTLDYPAFIGVAPAHKDSFSSSYTFEDTDNYVADMPYADNRYKTENAIKADLNSNLLSTSSFQAYNVTDFKDKNAFKNSTISTQQFGEPTTGDSIYEDYYEGKNILIAGQPTLIQFEALNKKLGIHQITANVTIDGYSYTDTLTSSTGMGNQGKDTCIDSLLAKFDPTDSSKIEQISSNTIKDFPSDIQNTTSVFKIYKAVRNDLGSRDAVWLGFYPKAWQDIEDGDDGNSTINIIAKSKGKYSNVSDLTTSTLSIPFNYYTKPRFIAVDSNDVEYSTGVIEASSKTELIFDTTSGGNNTCYKFKALTNASRPYIPLVNLDNDSNKNVIDSTISTFTPISNTIFTNNYISCASRQTPFVIEVLTNVHSGNQYPTYIAACDSNNDPILPDASGSWSAEWRTIGATPTYVNNELTFYSGYRYDDDNDVSLVLSSNNGSAPTASGNLSTITWPTGSAEIPIGAETNALTSLIPGARYKFRVTAANFCGTTTNEFVFKMQDPDPCTLNSTFGSLSENSTNISASYTHANITTGTPLNLVGSYTNGNGYTILPNSVMQVWIDGSPESNSGATAGTWPTKSITLSSGTHTIIISSPSFKKANNYVGGSESVTHTYEIEVTDAATTSVITSAATNVGINSATVNGNCAATGANSPITERGFILSSTESDITTYANQSGVQTLPATATQVSQTSVASDTLTYNYINLSPGTHYWYAAYAMDSSGEYTFGSKLDFETDNYVPSPTIEINNRTRTTAQIQITQG